MPNKIMTTYLDLDLAINNKNIAEISILSVLKKIIQILSHFIYKKRL